MSYTNGHWSIDVAVQLATLAAIVFAASAQKFAAQKFRTKTACQPSAACSIFKHSDKSCWLLCEKSLESKSLGELMQPAES